MNDAWKSLGGSTFWQDFVRGPGKLFESEVVTKMITDAADTRLGLLKAFFTRGYTHNTQVYLKRVDASGNILSTAKPIVVDNLLTGERKSISQSTLREWNGVFNDAKLTDGAGWTKNQSTELIDLFDADKNLTEIRFQIRSNRDGIRTGEYVIIKRENVFKTQYSGTGTEVRTLLDNLKFDDVKARTEVKPVF
ncbi:MAG: hypothetical protein U5N85_00345 [Arcicella sp.]|nr:hypothetical protein [Arcicella sp.]